MKVYTNGHARLYHHSAGLYTNWAIDPDGTGGATPLSYLCSGVTSEQLIALRDRFEASIDPRDARKCGAMQAFKWAIMACQKAEIHTVPEEVKPHEPFPW
jgi:hypothetical protein